MLAVLVALWSSILQFYDSMNVYWQLGLSVASWYPAADVSGGTDMSESHLVETCIWVSLLRTLIWSVEIYSVVIGVYGVINFTLKTMPTGGHLNGTLKSPSFHFPMEIRTTSSDLEVSKMSHSRWDVGSHIGRDSSYVVHIGTDNALVFFPASQLFIWQGSFEHLILQHGWLSE